MNNRDQPPVSPGREVTTDSDARPDPRATVPDPASMNRQAAMSVALVLTVIMVVAAVLFLLLIISLMGDHS